MTYFEEVVCEIYQHVNSDNMEAALQSLYNAYMDISYDPKLRNSVENSVISGF